MSSDWKGGYEQRPDWDVLFLTQAFLVAQRSIDTSCVHGAVLVSGNNRILSVGYNGGIAGVEDSKLTMCRPDKYYHLLHAEENCILNYNGSLRDLEDSTMYITGVPCHKCLRMILQKGIRKVAYGGVVASMIDDKEVEVFEQMKNSIDGVEVRYLGDKCKGYVLDLLCKTVKYVKNRG
jgi:dCMP deaminase